MNLRSLLKLAAVAGLGKVIYAAMDGKMDEVEAELDADRRRKSRQKRPADEMLREGLKAFVDAKRRKAEEELDRYKKGKDRFYKQVSEEEVSGFFDQLPSSRKVDWAEFSRPFQQNGTDRVLEAELKELCLRYDFKEVQRRLLACIDASGSPILRKAVVETTVNPIRIKGLSKAFERLDDFEIARNVERARSAGRARDFRPVTAIGIDISSYIWDGVPKHGEPLPFEVYFYTDHDFPFSTADHNRLVEIAGTAPLPWQGGGEVETAICTVGIHPYIGALLALREEEAWGADVNARIFLAEWWLYALIARELARALDGRPAPRVVPVILGTHGLGPHAHTVLYTRKHFEL